MKFQTALGHVPRQDSALDKTTYVRVSESGPFSPQLLEVNHFPPVNESQVTIFIVH